MGVRIYGSSVPADTGGFPATAVQGVSAARQDAMESYHPVPKAWPLSPTGKGMSAGTRTLQAAV